MRDAVTRHATALFERGMNLSQGVNGAAWRLRTGRALVKRAAAAGLGPARAWELWSAEMQTGYDTDEEYDGEEEERTKQRIVGIAALFEADLGDDSTARLSPRQEWSAFGLAQCCLKLGREGDVARSVELMTRAAGERGRGRGRGGGREVEEQEQEQEEQEEEEEEEDDDEDEDGGDEGAGAAAARNGGADIEARRTRAGNGIAIMRLAVYHRWGNYGVAKDEEHALCLYRRSAEAGCLEARSELAQVFEYGILGNEIDLEKALKWYEKADEQGPGGYAGHVERVRGKIAAR